MAIIECLKVREKWFEYYEYKKNGGHLSESDLQDLYDYISNEEYAKTVHSILNDHEFPLPEMVVLNKKNTSKKRIVYTYSREFNYVLKNIAYMLFKYDELMMPNLYSFRKNFGVKKAIADIIATENIDKMWAYKVDISDYFNSVDINILLPELKAVLHEDEQLYLFIERILRNPYVIKGNDVVEMKKGIMAGLPISAFLANLYLREMDKYFWEKGILYARYSDDIIVFAHSEDELKEYIEYIAGTLENRALSPNPDKQVVYNQGEAWEFLGFSYSNGTIDISKVALEKIKGKIKRKARALYRWKIKNNKKDEYAIRAFIKHFNRKFFDNPIRNELTWCRWYFPIINTDKSLHEIDRYMQSQIRYIVTGRFTKANYNLRYKDMQELGYRSLVNDYYKKVSLYYPFNVS